METEASIRKLKSAVSHHGAEVAELRADRELAVEYLKVVMEYLNNPDSSRRLACAAHMAEAYGDLGAVAAEAGISRESLIARCRPKVIPR